MGQKRTYKQYSKEFKEEAVALVREQGYSLVENGLEHIKQWSQKRSETIQVSKS